MAARGGPGQRKLPSNAQYTADSTDLLELQTMLQLEIEDEDKKKRQQQQQQQQYQSQDFDFEEGILKSVDVDDALVQELNRDTAAMQRDLEAVNEIIGDIGEQVQGQGEVLDRIEDHMEKADTDTLAAVYELGEAIKIQSSTRKTKAVIGSSVGLAAVGAVVGMVAGPAGGFMGAAAGAALGGMLGGGVGAGVGLGIGVALDQSSEVDKQRIDLVHKRTWISPKHVYNCMRCDAKFNLVRHNHHCRVCGGVFCRECCAEELPVLYEGVKTPILQRVCLCCRGRFPAAEVYKAGSVRPLNFTQFKYVPKSVEELGEAEEEE